MANLALIDYQIFQYLNGWAGQSAVFDRLAVFLARDLIFILIPVLLVYYLIKIKQADSKKVIITGAVAGLVSRFVIVQLIRTFYYRLRPFETHKVTQLFAKSPEASFPSGHAAALVAIGMAIYFYNKKLGIIIIVSGIIVGLARVIAGVHYPGDILGGIVVGLFTGWLVDRIIKKNEFIK